MNAVWLGVLLAGTLAVYALPTIRLSDTVTTVTVGDGTVADTASGVPGVVSWTGPVGDWFVTVTTGMTKPASGLGSASSPRFHLSEVNAFATGPNPNTLTIEFSETDFTVPLPAGAKADISWNSSNSKLSYETYVGYGNVLFQQSALITTMGPFAGAGSSVGSATATGSVGAGGPPVSFTLVLTITQAGWEGSMSADATLAVPDTGSSLLLLGSALGCLGLLARSRKN